MGALSTPNNGVYAPIKVGYAQNDEASALIEVLSTPKGEVSALIDVTNTH